MSGIGMLQVWESSRSYRQCEEARAPSGRAKQALLGASLTRLLMQPIICTGTLIASSRIVHDKVSKSMLKRFVCPIVVFEI